MMKFPKFSFKRWRLMAVVTVGGLAVVVGVAWAVLSFGISNLFKFGPTGGSLSSYLVGYFDTTTDDCFTPRCLVDAHNKDALMILYLTNPTPFSLKAYVDIFDDNETSLDCRTFTFSPNKVRRIKLSDFSIGSRRRLGMIKIFTEDSAVTTEHKIQSGLKGWLVHNFEFLGGNVGTSDIFSRESPLAEVPVQVLTQKLSGSTIPFEVNKIVSDCP